MKNIIVLYHLPDHTCNGILLGVSCSSTSTGPPEAPCPVLSVPWSKTCVMVQRRPESMLATMTTMKPSRLKRVSPYTSSSRPHEMMPTTAARFQLGLQDRLTCWHCALAVVRLYMAAITMLAIMTRQKSSRLKHVSPYTSSSRPHEMMPTTAAGFQLGLQDRHTCQQSTWQSYGCCYILATMTAKRCSRWNHGSLIPAAAGHMVQCPRSSVGWACKTGITGYLIKAACW